MFVFSALFTNAESTREIQSLNEARFERRSAAQNDSALKETQTLLQSMGQPGTENAAGLDQKARDAAAHARSVAPNAESEKAMYGIATDVLESYVQKTGGDPSKMNALAEEAKRDPARFYESLSDEQKAQIRSIADQIGRQRPLDREIRH